MRKEVEEDGIAQSVGKAKQCPCRTTEDGGSGRRLGMCCGMTAAALLWEDLEEGLTHWEREKCRVDKVTAAGNRNEIRGRRSQEQSSWEGTGMRKKSRETSKAEERKKG